MRNYLIFVVLISLKTKQELKLNINTKNYDYASIV